jgi:capsular exopolysaccharide synthesis family protein
LGRFLEQLDPGRPAGQSYDSLVASLLLLKQRALKTLLFTSTQPEEGKTTVLVGLALALARAGKHVTVVDADLRRPAIHQQFGLENREGLRALLDRSSPVADCIQPVGFPGATGALGLVTAGPPTNSPCFQAAEPSAVAAVLAELASGCDLLLIDSPPILSVADPLLLAPLVDGVVLVLQTGAVPEREVVKARRRLERAGAELLGVVMNRFDESLHGPSLHPYDAYYAAKP